MEQKIKLLLEDYQNRIKATEEKIVDLKEELKDMSRDSLRRVPTEMQITRLKIKIDYYSSFVNELERSVHSNMD